MCDENVQDLLSFKINQAENQRDQSQEPRGSSPVPRAPGGTGGICPVASEPEFHCALSFSVSMELNLWPNHLFPPFLSPSMAAMVYVSESSLPLFFSH